MSFLSKSEHKKEYLELIWILVIGFTLTLILGTAFGLIGGGFEIDQFISTFNFYGFFVTGGAIVLASLKFGEIITNGKIDAIIHDPEDSPSIFKNSKLVRNPIKLFIICVLIFGFLGWFGTTQNLFFARTPQFIFPEQQVTEGATLYFNTEPSATGETFLFVVIMSLILTGANYLFKVKHKGDKKWVQTLMTFVLPFVIGFLWMGYHSLRYGGTEVALFSTFLFGFLGALMTLLTNSIIPWWTWHFMNNFFFQANILFSDERILVFSILIFILFIIPALFILFKKDKNGRNDKKT